MGKEDNILQDNRLSYDDAQLSTDYRDKCNDDDLPTEPFAYFSPEERQILITKIIEKRRRATPEKGRQENQNTFVSPTNNHHRAASITSKHTGRADKSYGSINPQQYWAEDADSNSESSSSFLLYDRSGSVALRNRHYGTPSSGSPSLLSRSLTAPRKDMDSRKARSELSCDSIFKPRIKPLPSYYGGSKQESGPIYDRMLRWKREKDSHVARKQVEIEHKEVSECTFQPKINRLSEQVVAESRGNLSSRIDNSAFMRLYRAHEMQQKQKAALLEREHLRKVRRDEIDCTFQPKLATDQELFEGVKPRYNRDESMRRKCRGIEEEYETSITKVCTFAPTISELKSDMKAAKQYVNTPVVDRLTTPMTIEVPVRVKSASPSRVVAAAGRPSSKLSPTDLSGSVMSVKTRRMSFNQRLRAAGSHSRCHSAWGSDSEHNGSVTPSRPRPASAPSSIVDSFLQRTEHFKIRRSKELDELQRRAQPTFTPTRVAKHTETTDGMTHTSFYDRVERYILRQREKEGRNEVMAQSADARELTFRPSITKRSSRLRSRSAAEMSLGDSVRRETNQRLKRLQYEQEELSLLTFQPALTLKAHEVKSSLRLRDDPGWHLDQQKRKAEALAKRREEQVQRRARDELEGCTFRPSITPCPEYVRRIADSLSRIRSTRGSAGSTQSLGKPDWK